MRTPIERRQCNRFLGFMNEQADQLCCMVCRVPCGACASAVCSGCSELHLSGPTFVPSRGCCMACCCGMSEANGVPFVPVRVTIVESKRCCVPLQA